MAEYRGRKERLTERRDDPRAAERFDAARFAALTAHAQDVISVIDAAFRVRYVSPAIERVLGYSAEELQGVVAPGLAHPEDLPQVIAALQQLLSAPGTTRQLSARGRHKDGSYRWFDLVAHNLLHDPSFGAIVVNSRDVTEQHEMLAALAASERRFRMIAENARDIVARYRLWPDPALEYVSPAVERLLGYTPEQLCGSADAFLELIDPEHRTHLIHLMGEGMLENTELQTLCWRHKDGRKVWMEQQTVFIRDPDGRIVAAETIARDVSEKKKLAQQLQEARKHEAIGRLGAGIAHDFNNLLMEIFAHLSRVESLPHEPAATASLLAIKDSARRAAALSDQLLSFAQKGVRKSVVVDLSEAVDRLELSLRRSLPPNVALRVERRACSYHVLCDPSQLDQILLNLAQNARDAMPDGGTLTLRVKDGEPGHVRLEVEDTGVGIADEDVPHLFEPFFSKKQRPTSSGLGLAVVQRIVETLSGTIRVHSRFGEGARFSVELPTTDAPAHVRALPAVAALGSPASTKRSPADESLEPRATLLLVDDQRTVREVLGQLLRDAGYRVLEAHNGVHALELAEHETISILVTDIVMPDLDGPALLERLRARTPELPAVCISGYAGDEIDQRVAPNRITSFLAKPFAPEELLQSLEQLLAVRREGAN